jgi:hypothetical protein
MNGATSGRCPIDVPDPLVLLVPARAAREHADVFLPIVVWQQTDGGSPLLMMCAPVIGVMGEDISFAFAEIIERYGPPVWFAVIADAYAKTAHMEGAEPPLAEAFKGGDPAVMEQLVMVFASHAGIKMYRQVYRYTPVDGWEWDKPVEFDLPGDELLRAVERVPLQ